MSLDTDIRNLAKWLNEEQTAPIDRPAMARLLAWAQLANKPAAWVYPEFFERIEQAGCWTAYAGDGVGQNPDGVERIPLFRGPPKPSSFPAEAAAFKAWFDAWWLGDGEQGETIPGQSAPHFLTYLDQYTLGFGAWMAAKHAARAGA